MKCERCGIEGAESRRQNTQYVDDAANFHAFCVPCQEHEDKYWADRWSEYYAGCL